MKNIRSFLSPVFTICGIWFLTVGFLGAFIAFVIFMFSNYLWCLLIGIIFLLIGFLISNNKNDFSYGYNTYVDKVKESIKKNT